MLLTDELLAKLRYTIACEQAAGDGSYAAEICELFADLDQRTVRRSSASATLD